jgi:hypothetical protein
LSVDRDEVRDVVGKVGLPGHAKQIAADRATVVADPCGKPFGLMILLVGSHAIQYKRSRNSFIARSFTFFRGFC